MLLNDIYLFCGCTIQTYTPITHRPRYNSSENFHKVAPVPFAIANSYHIICAISFYIYPFKRYFLLSSKYGDGWLSLKYVEVMAKSVFLVWRARQLNLYTARTYDQVIFVQAVLTRTSGGLENPLPPTFFHSERSEECIDFTMMCVFFFFFFFVFVSVYSITSRNNAPISNYGGGFRCKSEYPWCIVEHREKPKKKIKKNGNFYAKPVFDQIEFFLW
ncbi:Uncharacterized protein FWK35_00028068, partial [Aphis craccivora]